MKLEVKSIIYTAVFRDNVIKTNNWKEFLRRLNREDNPFALNITAEYLTTAITIPDPDDGGG